MIIGFSLRSAWLLLGAAIAVALVLVIAFAGGLGPRGGSGFGPGAIGIGVVAVMVGAALIGLLPGVRELEVTAASSLLRTTAELVAPARPTAQHRIRTAAWTVLHALSGLAAGILLFGLLPAAVLITVQSTVSLSAGFGDLPGHRWPPPAQVAVGIAGMILIVSLLVVLGLLSRWAVPFALGPTSADRLLLAEARLAKEAHQVALARELHDGIGHALSAISVQAAGGRRVLTRDTEAAGRSLASIEETARHAQEELDGLLRALREPGRRRTPEPDLGQLGELIETHRRLGLVIADTVDLDPSALPGLVSTTGYRVVAEALGNAHTHAGVGTVRLGVVDRDGALRVEVTNPRRERARGRATGGRGLAGLTERVAVLGGTVDAGSSADRWILTAIIPYGSRS